MILNFTERSKRYSELPIVKQAFERQKNSLPSSLCYHDINHVIDVFNEVVEFASEDKLDPRSIELLAIAAVFHDVGFIDRSTENELLGSREAIAAMKTAGSYTDQEIELVSTMILDTQFRFSESGPCQVPTTDLSKYLCDADVSNLGRKDFFIKADLVRKEIGNPDRKEFLIGVNKFLNCHQWYTAAGKKMRQTQKDLNHAELRKLIS